MSDKKSKQLGMNASTANGKLMRDILFDLVMKHHGLTCYRCGEDMTRETFSIEHKVPWLDSESPRDLFFDLDNIAFSHHSCNVSSSRNPRKIPASMTEAYAAYRKAEQSEYMHKYRRTPEYRAKRRKKYLRTGN